MTRPPVRGDDDYQERRAPRHAAPGDDVDDGYEEHDDEGDWDEEVHPDDQWDDGEAPPPWEDWDDDDEDLAAAGEYEDIRPPSSRARRVAIVLGSLVVLFLLVAGGLLVWVRGQLDPGGDSGAEVRFTVPAGSSVNAVADLLADEGIINDAQIFRWYMRYKGVDSFQAGDYLLNENMAAWDVVEALSADPLPIDSVAFTVPEGLTVAEVPEAIVADIPSFTTEELAGLIAGGTIRPALLDPANPNLEGFLFPDTYELLAGQGPDAALQRMAQQFDAVAAEIDLVNRAAALGRTPYEIVTIASLIQEEYGIPEEMGKISRVIYNRLDMGEPLGIDATSRYEAVLAGRERDDIDLESESPYNTRRNAGLPPTPIALPGRLALEAALNPEPGPWIYYVRDPDTSRTPEGGHFFTDSGREFENVKAECEAAGLGCG
jgi:UPF0755 protein